MTNNTKSGNGIPGWAKGTIIIIILLLIILVVYMFYKKMTPAPAQQLNIVRDPSNNTITQIPITQEPATDSLTNKILRASAFLFV